MSREVLSRAVVKFRGSVFFGVLVFISSSVFLFCIKNRLFWVFLIYSMFYILIRSWG